MRPVVLVNQGSGSVEEHAESLRAAFPDAEIVTADPEGLADAARRARDGGAPYVAVAGGDGTMNLAAQELAGSDVPLLPVPCGTRNHFARDLGVDEVEVAADLAAAAGAGSGAASGAGGSATVDLGRVADRYFVNNSSLGLYPRLVAWRERYERRFPHVMAHVAAAWRQMRHGRRVSLTLDGEPFRAWIVFVGNGRYGERLFDITERSTIDGGLLDVRVVRADGRLARLRVTLAFLFGWIQRSPLVVQRRVRSLVVDGPGTEMEVALDGEVVRLPLPLEYESVPDGLRVLAAADGAAKGWTDRAAVG